MAVGATATWTRGDRIAASVVVFAAVLPRVLLRGRGALDLDSALLALGVESYDFASYHPHPPYHALSIAAAKLLTPWLDAADALVWVSLGALAALAFAVFAVGRDLGGRLVGAYAGALVALSPLVTENAGVSLTYLNEAAATAVVAWLALRARVRRDLGAWIALGVAASIAVGIRPSAAITAGPLMLWAIGRDVKALARAGLAGAAATVAWLAPTLVAGGGWADFRFGNAYQTRLFVLHDPVWRGGGEAVANNLAWLAHHLRAEMLWLACSGLLVLVAVVPLWTRRGRHRGFLLAWGGPSLLFYGLVYGGWPVFHSGYALGLLGPVAVAGAWGLRAVQQAIAGRVVDRPLRVAATLVVVAIALLPAAWPGAWAERLEARRDADAWERSWAGLEETLPPDRTALVGAVSIHWAVRDHPEYLAWVVGVAVFPDGSARLQVQETQHGRADKAYFDNVRDGPDDAPHAIPDWVQEIAVVEGHPQEGRGGLVGLPPKRIATLPGGAQVAIFDARAVSTVEDLLRGWTDPVSPAGTQWPPT